MKHRSLYAIGATILVAAGFVIGSQTGAIQFTNTSSEVPEATTTSTTSTSTTVVEVTTTTTSTPPQAAPSTTTAKPFVATDQSGKIQELQSRVNELEDRKQDKRTATTITTTTVARRLPEPETPKIGLEP